MGSWEHIHVPKPLPMEAIPLDTRRLPQLAAWSSTSHPGVLVSISILLHHPHTWDNDIAQLQNTLPGLVVSKDVFQATFTDRRFWRWP